MPDGTVPERVASELERKGVEAVQEAAEAALESENPEKAKTEVQKDADAAIVEVKDYMGIAGDPADPSLTDEVRKQAEAVEGEIRAAADEARAKIDRITSGDSSPSGSPEAEIALLKKENVTSATGETETLAKTEAAPLPVAEVPKMETKPASAEAPLNDLSARTAALVEEYKGSNKTASKLLQKKLLKLMAETNPDAYPNDEKIAGLRSMLGRLKMAFEGDERAWSTPQGIDFEKDFQNLRATFESQKAEPVTEPSEESSAESAAESFSPESVMNGFSAVAAELLRTKGKLSAELRGRYEELMRQRMKLKYGKDREAWKAKEPSAEGLANVVDRFSSHPVGMLQGLATYLAEHPDVAAQAGVSAEDVKKQLKESATEISSNPKNIGNHLGRISAEMLSGGGEFSADMVSTMDRLRDELDLVRELEGETMNDEGWKGVANALDHLQMIYSTTDAPLERLKGLLTFVGDNPEMAASAGVNRIDVEKAIEEMEKRESLSTQKPSVEAVKPKTPEAEPEIADIREMNAEMEMAFQTGNQDAFGKSVEAFEKVALGNASALAKEIDRLEKLQPEEREAGYAEKLETFRLQKQALETTVEWRNAQRELLQYRKELVLTVAELDGVTRELEQRSTAQTHNLLAQNAEEGRVLAVPEEDPKIALQTKQETLTAKRDALLAQISGSEASVASLFAQLEKINALVGQAAEEGEEAKAKQKKNSTKSTPDGLIQEGADSMPGVSAPEMSKSKNSRFNLDIEKGIIKTGEYIHDPSQVALDLLDAMVGPPKKKND